MVLSTMNQSDRSYELNCLSPENDLLHHDPSNDRLVSHMALIKVNSALFLQGASFLTSTQQKLPQTARL